MTQVVKMKKVIVIGGGYGGLRAVENLVTNDQLEITLIDKNPYHYLQTEAYGYIAGRFDLHSVAIDINNWCHGFKNRVNFIQKEVTFIDLKKQFVQMDQERLFFDYLIIAIGAETNFFSFIDGLRENSMGVKKLTKAFNFRAAFEKLLYTKVQKHNYHKDSINIAIGGAGLSGVEIAAEMADVIKKHTKSIGSSVKDIKIYLIDASSTILPGMSSYIIKHTHERLEQLGIKIMSEAFIQSVDEEQIHFKDGRTLKYEFMIFTGGIKVPHLNFSEELEKNSLNQFLCDNYLHIKGYENVFAIGDCAELHDIEGTLLAPTAQTAERSAEYVARNIHKLVNKREIEAFNASVDGVFVALGGNYAVGEMFRVIKVKGFSAYLLKKFITFTYHLGLKLRVNTGFKKRFM